MSKQRDVNGGLLTSPRLFALPLFFYFESHSLLTTNSSTPCPFSCLAYRRYALFSLHLLSLCLLPSHCSYGLTTWELHCQRIIPRLIDKSHTLVSSIPAVIPDTHLFYPPIQLFLSFDRRSKQNARPPPSSAPRKPQDGFPQGSLPRGFPLHL